MTPCMQGLQGEMTEVVAQGNSNVVELHREVQDVVESRDLPVNRDVTKEVGGAKEKLQECFETFPVGFDHEERVKEGMRHVEEVIEESTPRSVQTMMLTNVAGEAVTEVQQLDDAVKLLKETQITTGTGANKEGPVFNEEVEHAKHIVEEVEEYAPELITGTYASHGTSSSTCGI